MSLPSIQIPNEIMLGEVSRMLAEGHEVQILTKGNSMLPFIHGGKDSVRLAAGEYAPGDVALAQVRKGFYVLHRIVSISEDGMVVLKGDGNLQGVEKCRISDVAGKAIAVIRPSGREFMTPLKRARRWNSLPYIVRRFYLAIYRRLI